MTDTVDIALPVFEHGSTLKRTTDRSPSVSALKPNILQFSGCLRQMHEKCITLKLNFFFFFFSKDILRRFVPHGTTSYILNVLKYLPSRNVRKQSASFRDLRLLQQ